MPDPLPNKPAICISLPSGRVHVLRLLRNPVTASADLVEIRLDLLQDPQHLEALVEGWDLPVVAACRREEDGGRFRGEEEDRLRVLQRAAAAGAALVDVEDHSVAMIGRSGWPDRTRFLVSKHEGTGTFDHPLSVLYRDLAALRPAMVKLVPTARSLEDGFCFLRELAALAGGLGPEDPPVSAFCMGEAGIFTRILAFSRGASMIYASVARETPVAPGQLSVDELNGIYRVREIGPETCFTGILGHRVARSLSPLIHNHLYRTLDLDRCYLPLSADASEVPGVLSSFKAGELPFDLGGLSVTAPLKMTVIPFLDELAPCAGRVGAVNTLVRRPSGRLRGFNTDVHGLLETLRTSGIGPFHGRQALIIGAGGAARAAALALESLGMKLSVVNRTPARARELARAVGGEGGGLDAFCGQRFHLVVNASTSPPGEERGAIPAFQLIDAGTAIFDLDYHPPLTPLLAAGRRLGCRTMDGLEMLACQGERQFRLFTGIKPPSGAMLEILRAVGGAAGGSVDRSGVRGE